MAGSGASFDTAKDGTKRVPSELLLHGFQRFAMNSWAGGVLLILATVAALVWANFGSYEWYDYIFNKMPLKFSFGDWYLPHIYSWGLFINDALMALFFLFVGLEIKREIVMGELRSLKKASLPIAAALGGMAVPAAIYVAINASMTATNAEGEVVSTMNGWGVPMATDIAFALGILMLLGKRAPLSLKVFLTSLAIVDDLGALAVIALFYTEELKTNFLWLSAGAVAFLFVLNLLRFRHPLFYIVPGIALWVFVLESGVHATIAGVLLAATIPASARVDSKRFITATRDAVDYFEDEGKHGATPEQSSAQRAAGYAIRENVQQVIPPLHRMEHALAGWCAFFIIPVFALANAGLLIQGDLAKMATDPVTMGVFFGLSIGKPIGVVLFCVVAVKIGVASLPLGVSWRHITGAGCLSGIGFTMALFIANLAFKNDTLHLDASKIGILSASLISTIAGVSILLTCKPEQDNSNTDTDDASDTGSDAGSGSGSSPDGGIRQVPVGGPNEPISAAG
ncbi:MAG: Na+/H+ antiporter NhaA [Planctomycetota bacterium]